MQRAHASADPAAQPQPAPRANPVKQWHYGPRPTNVSSHPSARRRRAAWSAVAALFAAAVAGTLTSQGIVPGWMTDAPSLPAQVVAPLPPEQATPTVPLVPTSAMCLGNAGRTGEVAGPGPTSKPDLVWRLPLEGGHYTDETIPIVAHGSIYVASINNDTRAKGSHDFEFGPRAALMTAFDSSNGEEQWRTPLTDQASASDVELSTPALADGTIVITISTYLEEEVRSDLSPFVELPREGSTSEEPELGLATELKEVPTLVALDARTGAERWRRPGIGSVFSPPAILDGVVYTGLPGGGVAALDLASGAVRWRSPSGGRSFAVTAGAGGIVVVADDGLAAIDARSGKVRWRNDLPASFHSTPAVAGDSVYAVGSVYGDRTTARLSTLNAVTGEERWHHDLQESTYSVPLVGNGLVILPGLGDSQSRMIAFDAATGEERWRFDADGWITDPPVLANGVLYLHGYDQGLFASNYALLGAGSTIYALDVQTGRELWHLNREQTSNLSPMVADGRLYLLAPNQDEPGTELLAYGAE